MSGELTYKDSGVDKEAGYTSVELMREHVKKTLNENVLSDIGGFGALFQLNKEAYDEPVLVSGTDGVGTKLMIAFAMNQHDTIGEDVVAMCVNDVVCQGAKPLFFLDYIATGKLNPMIASDIVKGVAKGCLDAGAALIGGETAEMPGLYRDGEYDLAGFCVGVVDKNKIISGKEIVTGDCLIGIPSSGLHSNGYSLVRKLFFEKLKWELTDHIPSLNCSLGEELLKPTRIYARLVQKLTQQFQIKGISHITGGGFFENIPRMLPKGMSADLDLSVYDVPEIFKLIQREGNIDSEEMYATFNMGIGLVLAVSESDKHLVMDHLSKNGENAKIIGRVVERNGGLQLCQKKE